MSVRRAFSDFSLAHAIARGEVDPRTGRPRRAQRAYGFSGAGVVALCGGGGASGIFSPPSVSSTLVGLYDMADASTVTHATTISQVNDKSGAGGSAIGNATQPTGGIQPTYDATAINGKPGMVGNGSSTYMYASVALPTDYTVFVVGQLATSAATQGLFSSGSAPLSGTPRLIIQQDTTNNWRTFFSAAGYSALNGSSPTATPFCATVTYTSGSQASYYNNTLGSTSAYGAGGSASSCYFLAGYNGYFNGSIGLVVVYNSVLSSGDRTSVYNAIKTAGWGVP